MGPPVDRRGRHGPRGQFRLCLWTLLPWPRRLIRYDTRRVPRGTDVTSAPPTCPRGGADDRGREPAPLAAKGAHHPGRDGRRHLGMAPGAGRRLASGLHGRGVGNRDRQRGGAPAPGWRPRRPHAPGHRGVPRPGGGGQGPGPLLPPIRAALRHTVPARRDAHPRRTSAPARPHGALRLRRGEPRPGRPPRQGGHQPDDQAPPAHPAHPLRRHAGRRRLRPDGRGHPPRDPRHPRRLRGGAGGQREADRRPDGVRGPGDDV